MATNRLFYLPAQGNSMAPLIQSNDQIVYRKIKLHQLKVGDIVLYQFQTEWHSHRIIYLCSAKKLLVTKGDNNLKADSPIAYSQLRGLVVGIKRQSKFSDFKTLYQVRGSIFLKEAIALSQKLTAAKVIYVFPKGPFLNLRYEGSFPQQLFLDLDILVSKQNLKTTRQALANLGYKPLEQSKPTLFVKRNQGFQVLVDLHHEPHLVLKPVPITQILYPQSLLISFSNDLLKHRQKITIKRQVIYLPEVNYLIIYLALHLFHHNFSGGLRYSMLDRIIRAEKASGRLDRSQITAIIKKYQLAKFLQPVFNNLSNYYQTPINFFKKPKSNQHSWQFLNELTRVWAGILRFFNLWYRSPQPFWIRWLLLFHPQIWFSGLSTVATWVARLAIFQIR